MSDHAANIDLSAAVAALSAKIDRLTEMVRRLEEQRPRRRKRQPRQFSEVGGIRFTSRQREVLMAVGEFAGNIAAAARSLKIDPSVCSRHYQRAIAKARKAGVGAEVRRCMKLAMPSRATALPPEKFVSARLDGKVLCTKKSLSRQGIGAIEVADDGDGTSDRHDFAHRHDRSHV